MQDGIFFIKEIKFTKGEAAISCEQITVLEKNSEVTHKKTKTGFKKHLNALMSALYVHTCKLFYECETYKEMVFRKDAAKKFQGEGAFIEEIPVIGDGVKLHKINMKNGEFTCEFGIIGGIKHHVEADTTIKTDPIDIDQRVMDKDLNYISDAPENLFYDSLVALDDALQQIYPDIFIIDADMQMNLFSGGEKATDEPQETVAF